MTTELPEPIMLSALQHWSYCPRQCALIHVEQTFTDNVHTARGNAVHALVDIPGYEARPGVRIERALPLFCDRLGLTGKADVVEFLPDGSAYPVEYKHGPRRAKLHDELQLAAQALCLEEMTGKPVPVGAIYHATSHRRREVPITPALRAEVECVAHAIRHLLACGQLPKPANDARCRECSLIDQCQPAMLADAVRQRQLRAGLFKVDD